MKLSSKSRFFVVILLAGALVPGILAIWKQTESPATARAAAPRESRPGQAPPATQAAAAAQAPAAAKPVFTTPQPATPEAEQLFSRIGGLEKGTTIRLPLPDGGQVEAVVNNARVFENGATSAVGSLADGSGIFEIATEPGGYRGFILPKTGKAAYVYSGEKGMPPQVARRPRGEVICEPDPNFKPVVHNDLGDPQKAAIYNEGRSVGVLSEAVPILHSLPRANATIYLDFDGEIIEGHSWEGGRRIIARTFNLTANEITEMWKRVAEDFAPFEVNVTTDLQAYLRAPNARRMRCVITPDNFAPGSGGVAFNNTFQSSGDPVCWVFMTGKAGTDAISHEVGHTFGLSHDALSTSGYYGGHGSGATSWGPIMGAPYGANVTQWSKGDYPDANEHQDDFAIIGASVPRRQDDHFPTAAQATPLTLAAGGAVNSTGVIGSADDVDAFSFTTGGGTLNLQFNGASSSPDLDIEVKLHNSSGTLVATSSPANQITASLNQSIAAGTYTVTVDGVGNATWATNGYDDYGSLGAYTITGTVPSPSWTFQIPANSLNNTVAGTVAPGSGSAYSITAGNTGGAFAIDSSTGAIRVANAASLSSGTTFNLTVAYTAGSPTSTTVPIRIAPLRGLKQEIWTGLGGSGIGPLTSLGSYPNSPNLTRFSPIVQSTLDADNYGQKLSGYLLPTETGNHTFWTSADDYCELWLSTDANPANKVKIASNSNVTAGGTWTAYPSQQSSPVSLVAGQRYYIEVLHRDQTGPDQVSVAWQTPTLDRRLIPSQHLEYPGTWVNLPPWIAKMTYRIREGSTVGTNIATLVAGDSEPGSVVSGFTITGGNTGNAFSLNSTTGLLTVNGALSFATLPKYFLDVQATDSGGLTTTAQIAVEVEARAVKREYYAGINGTALTNLTSAPGYPNSPTSTTYQAALETPSNSADNYGQRLSGYLRAPDSGSFTFWIAADDSAALYLSTDTNPANKVRIAYTDNATASREWTKFASQRSAAVTLEGGKFYYLEVLHKEGGSQDNLAVSWSGPDFGQSMLGSPHLTQDLYNHAAPVLANSSVTVFNRSDFVTQLEAKDWSDPGTKVTYSITGGNSDGAFTIDPNTGVITRTSGYLPTGTRVLTITATDNGPTPLSTTATVTVQVQKAAMKREVWTGLSGGNAVSELTGSLYYPHTPDQTGYVAAFQAPSNFADSYGQRLSAYLIPPVTGSYTFWIASDDGSELWLSTDSNPANKKLIASLASATGDQNWTANASQQSVSIPLVAGQPYYIEALQKDGAGGDHLAAAWQGPGFSRVLIPGTYLEYPDGFRTGVRRESWNAASASTWSRSLTTGQMEWSTALFTETFEGTGALSGNTTESGGGTWGATSGWTRNNGHASKTANGDYHALLPFTPQAGNLYTLSVEIDPTNSPGTADWFALGFTNQDPTNTAIYTQGFLYPNTGRSWMLLRGNGSDSGNTMQAFSSALNNGISASPTVSAVGTYDNIAVVLDTRGANWISRYYFNGTLLGSRTHSATPTILSAGFSSYSTVKGNVRNFRLSVPSTAPASGTGMEGSLFALKTAGESGDYYCERLTGFIVPPATGSYTFWLASDDEGELHLSTDESPANLALISSVASATGVEDWTNQPSQQSTARTLVAGKRYYYEVRHRDGNGPDNFAVAWQGPGITRQVIGNEWLEHPYAPADRSLLQKDMWTGITGDGVTALTGLATYPASPNSTGTLTTDAGLVAPTNTADNYGQRLTGFIVAPENGRYTFWIASDNGSELWISSDDNPTNRSRVAYVSNVVNPQTWDTQANQKSVPLAMTAGNRYYVEIIHKEGTGGDHLAVAWQGPSFGRRVIPNGFLEHPRVIPGKPALKREIWTGITGNAVSNLTASTAYQNGTVDARGILTGFEAITSQADNYGQRVSGLLVPPESGSYTFWIASDDASELWLSTDSNRVNRMKIAQCDNSVGARAWTVSGAQQSSAIMLTAGQRYYIEALQKDGTGGDHLSVAWQGPSFSRHIIPGKYLEYVGTLTDPAALKREVWTGVSGDNVSNLTSLGTYPASPNQTLTLDTFDTPANAADNYGDKVSGYLIAPYAGDYQFWIASDDGGELWLATDGNPANKTRIAYTTGATDPYNWTRFTTQASATITLAAGQRCYIEALHKEGGGDDYLSVAWQGPGFSRQIIRKPFLDYPGVQPESPLPVPVAASSPFSTDAGYNFWINYHGLTGTNRNTGTDTDADGLANGLEFLFGGNPTGTTPDAVSQKPEFTTDGDRAVFVYRRSAASRGVTPVAEVALTLDDWRAATTLPGVEVTTEPDGFGPGIDKVTVRCPLQEAGKLFFRINSGTW